jgi:hypothetical protein
MAPQLRKRDPAWAAIWFGFCLGFASIGATMTYPHPWFSPETSVAVATTSFVGAVLCFARAVWYGVIGAPTLEGVSWRQHVQAREQLRKEIAEQDAKIAELQDANSELARIAEDQKHRLSIVEAIDRDAPRHLSSEAREVIRERLKGRARAWQYRHGIPEIAVYYVPGSDSAPYAQEFSDLLVSLDFHVSFSVLRPEYVASRDVDYYRFGIFVLDVPMTLHDRQPTFGDALHKAMAAAGISSVMLDREGRGCILIIGAKTAEVRDGFTPA